MHNTDFRQHVWFYICLTHTRTMLRTELVLSSLPASAKSNMGCCHLVLSVPASVATWPDHIALFVAGWVLDGSAPWTALPGEHKSTGSGTREKKEEEVEGDWGGHTEQTIWEKEVVILA